MPDVSEEKKGELDQARERDVLLALTAQTDPVLAELWDNAEDAAYDSL